MSGDDARESLSGASVLVTGGAGFVGSHLADALADVCDVTVLDDLSGGDPGNVPPGVALERGDVRDAETVRAAAEGVDVVFHQAGMVSVDESVERPVENHGRNATGTVTVLDAARRADARVVVASSAAVYGQPDTLPIHESDRKTPTTPYGIAKLSVDHHTRRFADLYGLPTVALRYFNVYGPGPTNGAGGGVVEAFIREALRDEPLRIHGDGTQTRDFVHVRDVVEANLLAATTGETGQAYNVGTGVGVSIREIAERVSTLVDGETSVLHQGKREGDIKHSRAAIGRARTQLGYEPSVSLSDGLASMIDAVEQ